MQFVLLLLLLLVGILAGTGIFAVRLYRDSVLFVGSRSQELPVAAKLCSLIGQLRVQVSSIKGFLKEEQENQDRLNGFGGLLYLRNESDTKKSYTLSDFGLGITLKQSFVQDIQRLIELEQKYETVLQARAVNADLPEDRKNEALILEDIQIKIQELATKGGFPEQLNDVAALTTLGMILDDMQFNADLLLNQLLVQLTSYSDNIKAQYRWFLVVVITAAITSGVILAMLLRLMYVWIFRPLRELVAGSQMVAQGRFNFRIKLDARDEMSQLADAFNKMTEQFETIRNDLDRQVQTKSKELVRTERLASVGFLAAGVAHEINNPLASIAMSAESLQRRILPMIERLQKNAGPDAIPDGERMKNSDPEIIRRYLNMIQEEAFRCKGITEKLLDFARTERKIREQTNLSELVTGIVEMIHHLGKYRGKHIRLEIPPVMYALVNPQEMKQVTLNLMTNALDSVDDGGGTVWVRLFEKEGYVHLVVEDDGCGMNSEVLQNVFEPFFTTRKNGQGTGLGLSITHRIVSEHLGRIDAHSAGLGCGSTFQIEIPLTSPEAERLAAMKSKEILAAQRRAA